jgi:asparagine synthase (glutamine-hydrolysing)
MSAIYGIAGRSRREQRIDMDLGAMSAALRPRGPDDDIRWVDATNPVGLGFRFLRTAAGEASPGVLANEDRSLMMVCDGHVFNAGALRSYLRDRGHTIGQSHSCELLLHLYEDEGVSGWRRADGQFALALWDARAKRLVLGRDFLGVRPLYYWSSAEGIVFASEIKALLRNRRVPRAVDETALADFLTFTSVPGPRTLFRDIRKVQAGSAAICGVDGTVRVETYWDLLHNPIPESSDERFYVERVRALHHASVAGRDVDGPIGSLLSGGNDSSANASLLSRDRSRTLHTFTVGLADLEGNTKYNDIEYARRVASSIGSVHHERLLSTDEFLRTIPLTIDAMDDLVSEPSAVFLHHALGLAADEGLRVVITGEANDELSCGHGGMIDIRDGYYRRWMPYVRKPKWVRHALAGLAPALSPSRRDVLERAARGDEYFWSYETAWMDTDKGAVLAPDVLRGAPRAGRVPAAFRNRFDASPHAGRDYLAYVIYAMMQDFYFTNLMLGKLDLLAASLGIEPRCPYTAPAYAHFVFNIPASLQAQNGLVKTVFKKSIEGVLDHEVIYRPKQGFRTPVIELFRGALGKWAEPVLLDAGLTREGLLRRDHLAQMLRRHRAGERDYSNRLWAAMSLNLWHERWIGAAEAVSAA